MLIGQHNWMIVYLLSLETMNKGKGWKLIAYEMQKQFNNPSITPKRCRERWSSHINPEINKAAISDAECALLLIKHHELGNNWSKISRYIPRRYGSTLKNNFYSLIRAILRKIVIEETTGSNGLLFLESIYISWIAMQLLGKKEDKKWKKGDVPLHIRTLVIEKQINEVMCENYVQKLINELLKKYPDHLNMKLLKNYTNLKTLHNMFVEVANSIEERLITILRLPLDQQGSKIVDECIIEGINNYISRENIVPLPNIYHLMKLVTPRNIEKNNSTIIYNSSPLTVFNTIFTTSSTITSFSKKV